MRSAPVERESRDLPICTLMVRSPEHKSETLGRAAVGLEASVFNVPGMTHDPADSEVGHFAGGLTVQCDFITGSLETGPSLSS